MRAPAPRAPPSTDEPSNGVTPADFYDAALYELAPTRADLVFDCRFLPNPHWVEDLRGGTGREPDVRDYALNHPAAEPFLDQVEGLLALLVPEYETEGKAYLTIAFGCTGGHHRSVAVVEEMAGRLRAHGIDPTVSHRDITK